VVSDSLSALSGMANLARGDHRFDSAPIGAPPRKESDDKTQQC
jgi:hypothetical protein